MKYVLSILVLLHGSIHLMGFVKGFKLAPIPTLQSNVSPVSGTVWLIAFLLFTISAVSLLSGKDFWFYFALSALFISSFLIINSWSDAKYGMIPNVIILFMASALFSASTMNKMITLEIQEIMNAAEAKESYIVTDSAVKKLPAPVCKWIQNTGIVGKPSISTAHIKQKAWMKMKADQKDWKFAEAEQYTCLNVPAFIWTVKMDMMPLVKIKGRDKFINGKAEMLIKINSLFNVVNETGERIDEGTIQRFLGELVWYPSLALSPYITWESIDGFSAKANMKYKGTTGSGTFYFNENGDFIKFAALRFKGNEADAKRYPWILTVDDYSVFEGIKIPSKMKATWKLDEGDWTWLDLEVAEIRYNTKY